MRQPFHFIPLSVTASLPCLSLQTIPAICDLENIILVVDLCQVTSCVCWSRRDRLRILMKQQVGRGGKQRSGGLTSPQLLICVKVKSRICWCRRDSLRILMPEQVGLGGKPRSGCCTLPTACSPAMGTQKQLAAAQMATSSTCSASSAASSFWKRI